MMCKEAAALLNGGERTSCFCFSQRMENAYHFWWGHPWAASRRQFFPAPQLTCVPSTP
jgi:hypothetical protein